MLRLGVKLLRLSIIFVRNSLGCVNNPYITYRRLAKDTGALWQTIFIFVLVVIYFTFATAVRVGVRNPYLLTFKSTTLFWGFSFAFFLIISLLSFLGKFFGSLISPKTIFLLWSYTLLPTLTWFTVTSILYLLFPPPRTFSLLGKLYSLFFITFTIAVFLWKLILYYLTLRFGARLDLGRIFLVSAVLSPFLAGYSILMYRLGIFRIPFL